MKKLTFAKTVFIKNFDTNEIKAYPVGLLFGFFFIGFFQSLLWKHWKASAIIFILHLVEWIVKINLNLYEDMALMNLPITGIAAASAYSPIYWRANQVKNGEIVATSIKDEKTLLKQIERTGITLPLSGNIKYNVKEV